MDQFDPEELKKLYIPPPHSHKGQNGKLLLIGGSHLFHAASLWTLSIASKIVDMVFYSSVPENNEIVMEAKKTFLNGIVVRRDHLEDYMKETEVVLIGPGMVRAEHKITNPKSQIQSLHEINQLENEGEQSYYLTKYLLERYPEKKWVIDAGALQMMDPEWLRNLDSHVIITPHPKEFKTLFNLEATNENIKDMTKEYNVIIVVKGQEDTVCSPKTCVSISGGNAGMTKGGTGDVLAGLIASLATKNDMFLSAKAGSYINKKAGESLFKKVGYYFNASELVNEIPIVMKELIIND